MKLVPNVAFVPLLTLLFTDAIADSPRQAADALDTRAQIEFAIQHDNGLAANALRLEFMSKLSDLLHIDEADEFLTLWLADTNYWTQKFTNEDRAALKRYYFDLYGENLTILGDAAFTLQHEIRCEPLRNLLQSNLLAKYFGEDVMRTIDSNILSSLIDRLTRGNLRDDKVRAMLGAQFESQLRQAGSYPRVSTTDFIYVAQHQAVQSVILRKICNEAVSGVGGNVVGQATSNPQD